jgi:hypothetical protein
MPSILLILSACLVDTQLYEQRGRELRDDDGDGYNDVDGDCDDGDPTVHPAADEVCDGIDQNCSGEADEDAVDATTWFLDDDGDGYGQTSKALQQCVAPDGYVDRSGDCDDGTADRHTGLAEVAYDDVDQDCDGYDLVDVDGDGYDATLVGGDDCDDHDATVHPDATELWSDNGVDNDCDGHRDDVATWTTDEAAFRLDGASAGDELGETLEFWEEGRCLLAAAPMADGMRGAVYGVDSFEGTMVAGESGGTLWGTTASSELSAALSVGSEGRLVASEPVDDAGTGTVFLLDAAALCAGANGAVDSIATLTIEGDTASSWFGAEARWLDDVNGDGIDELAASADAYPGGGANRGAIFFWYDPPSDGSILDVDSADVVLYGGKNNARLRYFTTAADASGSGAPWLLVGGRATSAGTAGLYRVDGTELVTGSVADISDGGILSWTADQWFSLCDVGDIDSTGVDEFAAGVRVWGIWDVADLDGFWSESNAPRQLTYDENGESLSAVAPLGDFDGDDKDDFAMLAERWPKGTETGQLALAPGTRAYWGNRDIDFTTMPFFAEGAGVGDKFAYVVDRTGDLDDDGHDELIVSAPASGNGGASSGSIYLLPLPPPLPPLP